jgi:hypothetical protein
MGSRFSSSAFARREVEGRPIGGRAKKLSAKIKDQRSWLHPWYPGWTPELKAIISRHPNAAIH